MKRISSLLLIIVFTFGISVAATWLYLGFTNSVIQKSEALLDFALLDNDNASADLPIFAYCELSNNPEKYDGKIIRLSAKLSVGLEGSWFSDPNCGNHDGAIVSSKNEVIWHQIEQARKYKDKKVLSNEVDLIVVGKFKNTIYNYGGLITPFQFEILQVEKLSGAK